MEITVACRTDVGRVRHNNEDAFLCDPDVGLFVVCDGMGGHNAGEVASRTACEIIQKEIDEAARLRERFLVSGRAADIKLLRKAVESAVQAAGREIHRLASRADELTGMGTTCTVVLLTGHQKGILAHVGDSRLYVLRGDKMHQLSEDHTYVSELVKRGALTREQARHHPQGNVLSRALGVQPTVAVDTMVFDIDPGDTYLLCTDGLHNYFQDPAELARRFQGPALQAQLDEAIQSALERGGHDNCTAVAFRLPGATPADMPLGADQRIATLKRIPLFSYLTYNELVHVLGLTQLNRVSAGSTLIAEGDRGEELFVILAGEVEVKKGAQSLAMLKAGAHLGEMALIDNAPRSATVVAKTDVNLLSMHRDEFFALIRAQPTIATKLLWSFVQALSSRLRETNAALQGARKDQQGESSLDIFVDEEP
jgi:serine/threonine protein phosphatase PrpC